MKRFFLFLALAMLLFFSFFPPVYAEEHERKPGEGISLEDVGFKPGEKSNIPTLGLEKAKDPIKVVDTVLLKFVVNPIFFLAGGVAVVVIFYSSFRIMTARGEEEGLTAAKNALIWAFVGLALIVLAYTLVRNLVSIVLQQL